MMVDVSTVGMFLQRLGFADIMLWLLTFAIMYGVLGQANVPKSKEARAIISIVVGLLVLFAAPQTLVAFLAQMSASFVLVAIGLLVLIVFLEAAGIKHKVPVINPKTGKPGIEEHPFLSAHPTITGITFVIIAVLIFVGAGGLNLLGLKIPYGFDLTGVIFFVAIIVAILWILGTKE
jgi:hypothetical protein